MCVPKLSPSLQALLKGATDERDHLLTELTNAANAARRTAVQLRGRETGAPGRQQLLPACLPCLRAVGCTPRPLPHSHQPSHHALPPPCAPAEITQRDLEAVAQQAAEELMKKSGGGSQSGFWPFTKDEERQLVRCRLP